MSNEMSMKKNPITCYDPIFDDYRSSWSPTLTHRRKTKLSIITIKPSYCTICCVIQRWDGDVKLIITNTARCLRVKPAWTRSGTSSVTWSLVYSPSSLIRPLPSCLYACLCGINSQTHTVQFMIMYFHVALKKKLQHLSLSDLFVLFCLLKALFSSSPPPNTQQASIKP